MMDSCYLSDNLFSICIRLSAERSEEIACSFWKIMENELNIISLKLEEEFPDRKQFDKILRSELKKRDILPHRSCLLSCIWHMLLCGIEFYQR